MVRQRESVGMSGGHQRPHAFVRIRAGVCRPVRPCARVELRMLRTGAGQHEDMQRLLERSWLRETDAVWSSTSEKERRLYGPGIFRMTPDEFFNRIGR